MSVTGRGRAEKEGAARGMAPPPSARWLRLLAQRQPAELVPADARHACLQRVHSRLADGRLLCWQPTGSPGLSFAIDAEIEQQPVPPALAHRCAVGDPAVFWPLWTRAETRAKLNGIPILVWLRTHAWLTESDDDRTNQIAPVVTTVRDGVVVSYGAIARP